MYFLLCALLPLAQADPVEGTLTVSNGGDRISRTVTLEADSLTDYFFYESVYLGEGEDERTGSGVFDGGDLVVQGHDDDGWWYFDGACDLDGAVATCSGIGVILDNDADSCTGVETTFELEENDGVWTGCVGDDECRLLTIDTNGAHSGLLVDLGLDVHASTKDDGTILEYTATLEGLVDLETGALVLSWWNDRLCDGFFVFLDGGCSSTGSGKVQCDGTPQVWRSGLIYTDDTSYRLSFVLPDGTKITAKTTPPSGK